LNARQVFVGTTGTLRAPWRLAAFAVASIASLIVATGILGPMLAGLFGVVGLRGVSTQEWVIVAGLLGGTSICVRWIDKRPWSDVWLDRSAARPFALGYGFAIGALAIGIPICLLVGARWLREQPSSAGSWIAAASRVSFVLLPAALLEELLTRGYVLSVLRDAWGWPWAIVATSVGFGLLHLQNPSASVGSVTLVTLAGFFLAGVLYATRSLYAAWAAHFAWNWTMAVAFHTAVSGIPMEAPRYRYVDAGPDWATGGDWGPEGGVPAGLGMIAGIAYFFVRRRREPAREET